MTSATTLYEHLEQFLAQGLRHLAATDPDGIIQALSALKLLQPATLLTNIQRNISSTTVSQADSDTFIKVLHTLHQAKIQISATKTIEPGALTPLSGMSSVYFEQDILASADAQELIDIIDLPNSFVRTHCLREYLRKASEAELRQSIDIVWCDYALSHTIASALQTRPEDAISVAKTAIQHSNLVIQWTAIQVLTTVGSTPTHQQETLEILQTRLNYLSDDSRRSRERPMQHIIKEALARVNHQYDAYRAAAQRDYAFGECYIRLLRSPKKNERYAGIYSIVRAEHPYFAIALAEAAAAEAARADGDAKIVKTTLKGLFDIRGFEAIPTITRLLDGPYAKTALETLAKFGDRSGLRYLFTHLDLKAIPAHFRGALQQYGDLVLHPLCAIIKRLENPAAYKKPFAGIFASFRSDDFVRTLIAEAEHDPIFAEKLVQLVQAMYPKQFKTSKKKGAPPLSFSQAQPLLPMLLGGKIIPKASISAFLLTPDKSRLIVLTHTQQKRVTLFNSMTWNEENVIPVNGYPLAIGITPDGKYLLAAAYISQQKAYTVDIWEIDGQSSPIGSFTHSGQVEALGATSDSRRLLIGDRNSVRVVEFGSWKEVTELQGHEWRVSFLATIPEQRLLLTGDWQGWLQVWDETTLNQVARIKSDSWAPKFATLSSDRQLLVYAGHIGVHIWETRGWREIFSQPKPKNIDCMALMPDGKHLVAGIQKKLRILKLDTLKEIVTFESDTLIRHIEVTADGKHVITFGNKGLKVWNIDLDLIEHG